MAKVRRLLEKEYLCECLRGRVQYFNTRYRHVHDGMGRIALYVDGELWLNMTFMQEYIAGSNAKEYEAQLSMCQRYEMAEKELAQEGILGPWDFGDAVTRYLCNRFGKENIYIMGHSWGSVLGVLTVQQQPDLFHAYIGIGQVAQQDRSERLAYTYMLEEFSKANDKKMLNRIKKFPIENGGTINTKYLGVRSTGMNKLGVGVMRNMASMMDCVAIVLGFKEYTLGEKFKFPQGSSFSLRYLWDFVLQMNLFQQVPELKVPVYIFQGKYDYQVSYVVAKEFAAALNAPLKGFYTFKNSAHSPCFEEAEKICNILRVDVLQNQVSLSDVI